MRGGIYLTYSGRKNGGEYMGVRKKGRRRIVCDDQEYVWDVALDDESAYYILNICSEDKSLVLSYQFFFW